MWLSPSPDLPSSLWPFEHLIGDYVPVYGIAAPFVAVIFSNVRVIYAAAHGGFARQAVPLGGGAAVFEALSSQWQITKPFELTPLTPAILGPNAPSGRDLIRFGERDYARFCREFERASTREILQYDPSSTVVLINDISEAPDFAALAAAGFAMFTIYHVDVVAYVAAIYARSLCKPETLVRWHRRLRPLMPSMAGLVFDKQRDSVAFSRGIIVPSPEMMHQLLRSYPALAVEDRIHVLPWGTWDGAGVSPPEVSTELRAELGIPHNALCLLTLSRISPEKGQDMLLEALIEWERRGGLPDRPLFLMICGEAAFMQGVRFLERLKALAARLKRVQVRFPGYVTGARKQAFFKLAGIYVFPSRHESYGLTLLEALAAGVPAICLDHHGARSVMKPEFGEIISGGNRREIVMALRSALARLLADEPLRRRMGAAGQAFAATQQFPETARKLAEILAATSVTV